MGVRWPDVSYACFKLEVGEGGTPHFQGYVEFSKPCRKSALIKLDDRANWEKRRGTPDQARDYVFKDESTAPGHFPLEVGTFATRAGGQGRRSDLDEVVQAARSGMNLRDLQAAYGSAFIRYSRGLQLIRAYNFKEVERAPLVTLYYGPTGCGKSRLARSGRTLNLDLYVTPPVGSWFDGYDGQPVALMEDFDAEGFSKRLLLCVLDRYAVQLGTKGGHTWWQPEEVRITSNIHLKHWGVTGGWKPSDPQYPAVVRRFSRVFFWKQLGLRPDGSPICSAEPELISRDDNPGRWAAFWAGPDGGESPPPPVLGPLDLYVEHPPERNWYYY